MGTYTALLQQSYKKLKSSVYFDKTQLILRDELVKFESNPDFDKLFDKISYQMESGQWDQLFAPIYESISFSAFPKEINVSAKTEKVDQTGSNDKVSQPVLISNASCNRTMINQVQTFIDMDVLGHLMGVMWILIVGYKLDQDIYPHSYGNRLRKKLISDKGCATFSPYLFEPYFQQYESWRDSALNIARSSLSQGQDVVVLTLDFKRFFYSVNIDEQELTSIVCQKMDNESCYADIVKPLTTFISRVIEIYSKKVSEIIPDKKANKRVLPIGFFPSNILANYCLKKFDQEVVDGWNPLYYGRYVDDIIIVDKIEKNGRLYNEARNGTLKVDTIIDYFLTICDFWRRNDSGRRCGLFARYSDGLAVNAEFNQFTGSEIITQNQKVKAFYFESDQTDALIDCFRKKLSQTKSEFRYLPEDEPVFGEDDYSEIYSLVETDGPNKLRGVKDVIVDKFSLSKFLGKYQRVSGLIQDRKEQNFEKGIEKVFNNQTIIDNYLSWEKVLSILANNERFEAIKRYSKKVLEAIDQLDSDISSIQSSIDSVKVSLIKILVSALNRSLSVIWGPKVNAVVNELMELISDYSHNGTIDNLSLRKEYCLTRMCDKYSLSLLIDGFIKESKLFISDDHPVNLTRFSSGQLNDYNAECLTNSNYIYYPYLLTIHDLTWLSSIKNLLDGKNYANDCDRTKLSAQYFQNNYCLEGNELSNDFPIDFSNFLELPRDTQKNSIAIKIGNSKKEKIKIGIANTHLSEHDFEQALKSQPNRSYERYVNLTKIINDAIANDVDLLVMPEGFIPFEWIPILARTCAKNQMAIVTGVEHFKIPSKSNKSDSVYNLTAIILPYIEDDYKFSYIHFHCKVHLSPDERDAIESYRCIPKEGDRFELFCWNDFWFPVYCCYELASIMDRSLFQSYSDAIVAVEWNRDTKYYSNVVESLSRDLHCYCVQVNDAKYGDSRITQPAKTEEKDLLNVKGGLNPTILVETIDVEKLRNFQIAGNKLQKQSKQAVFKPTPPDFNYEIVSKKIDESLWEWLKGKS